ncbi:EAL domain-containing protein [Undibacterium parvum]|uniref:EAL domain-containing protein n=1 Tax=Undibacterium parvum TaxID=401471 RepID=A0A3Q9BSX2_9BURK|nr:EAL domain-containing protein [Undibacterium parvum]AZP13264.1 EAL domain-containing protein [Undibacterium parvum]
MSISTFNVDDAPCGFFSFDSSLRLVAVNRTLAVMLGTPQENLPGKPLDQLLSSANKLMFHMQVMAMLHIHGHVEEIAINLEAENGQQIPVLLNAITRHQADAAITECVVIRVNERQRLEDELFRIRKATEQVPGALYQFLLCADGSSRFPYASEGIRNIYELSPLQVQRNSDLAFKRVHPDDLDAISQGIAESAKNLTVWHQQYRVILPKRGMLWLEGQATPESRSDGSTLWHGYIKDISERKSLEIALANEYERTRVTLSSIGDAVITTDEFEKIQYLNPIAEQLTGWRLNDAIGLPVTTVFNIINQHSRLAAKNPIAHCLQERAIVGLARDTVLISRNGNEYAVEDSAAPIFTSGNVITGVVMVFRDVTGQRILRQEVERRATHDHLTGLANRAEFDRLLLELFDSSISTGTSHALCCIDLDQFKIVNDSCGHAAGDALLREVSELLLKSVRAKDTVARLGGDEFALLLEDCDVNIAQRIAQTVCDKVAQIRFQQDGKFFRVGASIGVAPLDSRWETAQAAQQAADGACFAAKDEGRGRVHIYEDMDKAVLAQHDQMQWATRLQQGIDENRFELFAQPIIRLDADAGKELHFEVLLRLRENDGKLVSPAAFIPAAERYGLVAQVDRWVVTHVFEWMNAHQNDISEIETIAINLSGKTVGDRDFHHFVAAALEQSHVPANKISFEITETAAIGNIDIALEFFKLLHQRGAHSSLDDFGSGMSSMAYLKHLPVDYLKIDGQFVKDMATDAVDCAMVRSINEIAHLTGKLTIAEFVENIETLNLLRTFGINFAQGYHVAKPMPINEILVWHRQQSFCSRQTSEASHA